MWAARDKDNSIRIYNLKPWKFEELGFWACQIKTDYCFKLPENKFPEVKWEDEEPSELILKR